MRKKNVTIIVSSMALILSLSMAGIANSQSFGNISLVEIAPRIITPNDDQKNDKLFFYFDSSITGIPLDASIYDINGAKINSLQSDLSGTALSWDGKDNVGRVVPSGVYLYQITIGKNSASGAIVVAK